MLPTVARAGAHEVPLRVGEPPGHRLRRSSGSPRVRAHVDDERARRRELRDRGIDRLVDRIGAALEIEDLEVTDVWRQPAVGHLPLVRLGRLALQVLGFHQVAREPLGLRPLEQATALATRASLQAHVRVVEVAHHRHQDAPQLLVGRGGRHLRAVDAAQRVPVHALGAELRVVAVESVPGVFEVGHRVAGIGRCLPDGARRRRCRDRGGRHGAGLDEHDDRAASAITVRSFIADLSITGREHSRSCFGYDRRGRPGSESAGQSLLDSCSKPARAPVMAFLRVEPSASELR